MFKRSAGILLHISCLPSKFGIGDFGPEAYGFVDFLYQAKQKYWQILPLNPTELIYGNCPYSSPSAYALNTLFISPELLLKEKLLTQSDFNNIPVYANHEQVDYLDVIKNKSKLFDVAFARFKDSQSDQHAFLDFCDKENHWLEPYALFVCCKQQFSGHIWSDWPENIRNYHLAKLVERKTLFADEYNKVRFLQYIAFSQWQALRTYCHAKKINLIGDIPIYVNEDSADVWSTPEIFKLNEQGKPLFVAGVPPDYFSKTGQRWGNPVYRWETIQDNGFQWWIERIRHNFKLYDTIRIDHFRGLIGYWEIPATDETAVNGYWVKAPGEEFLQKLQTAFPGLPMIAEDLGLITPDVTAAMHQFQLPGMKVLQFAFSEDNHHPYLPENYSKNCIVYSGTHDNNTTRGWFRKDASPIEKEFLQKYWQTNLDEANVSSALIDMAYHSEAVIAIIPLQDILNLGEESRMNIPGTVYGNWEWRTTAKSFSSARAAMLAQLTVQAQR